MKSHSSRTRLVAACFSAALASTLVAGDAASTSPSTPSWSGKQAAAYLDSRMTWWTGWNTAARDHETFCVSCHTVLPYALARPELRGPLAEQSPTPIEHKLLDNVIKRVRLWSEVDPFYPDKPVGPNKTVESRGTESILNALILARYDAAAGSLSPDAQKALANMWTTQIKSGDDKGAWPWLQFHNSPWEGDSQYYGSTLAAIAIGTAPGDYKANPDIQEGLQLLRDYLIRERDHQVLVNKVVLVWASSKIPGLLTPDARQAIINEALAKQQPDGGFSLTSFVGDWKRHDSTPLETKSDGFATGLVVFALHQAGVSPAKPEMTRATQWLARSQDQTEGRWFAYSLNKQRDLSTDIGRFMSDAATAYAVMALENEN